MKTKIFRSRSTQSRLEIGPFRDFLDQYVEELKELGFPAHYLRKCFRVIIRFSDWVGLKQIALPQLTEERLAEFLIYHGELRLHSDRKVLAHFVQFLRNQKLIPKRPVPKITCPMERALHEFEKYLREEKGLSEVYIYQQIRVGRHFLADTFAIVGGSWRKYTAQMIGGYLAKLLKQRGSSETKSAANHLAQFLKFLFIRGRIRLDLSTAVPRPACWRHTRAPICLPADDVKKLLASCDRQTQIGARDYAILVLLSQLGLRACEIRTLCLEDVHWREGAITVRGKGKESKMPLPKKAGAAIADYVKKHRPPTKSRAVFVSVDAPYSGFRRSASVSGIVKFALKRAKIESTHRGAYLLRHTVANEGLKNGASLEQIGQLLRHDQLSTTTIYAKVDYERLRLVTRPWAAGGVK